jgi:DNA repair exonuclease SbcCD ATPase subunit
VKLRSLRVDGFGRLADRDFAFGPGLNVVVGRNEAGKSTLAAALVASLYGLKRGEKDRWRPWVSGAAFASALTYETSDGATWEVHRAFDHDTKGVRVYDAAGADAAARIGRGKSLSPGEAHLQISLDVFLQTACVRQRAIAIDNGAANDVSTALAQALDGGPKEDAALGAIARLDDAVRKYVGTKQAHKNAPLKKLRELEQEQRRAADGAHAALERLGSLRERISAECAKRDRDLAKAAALERRTRALRAAQIRARLAQLKEHRADLATVQAERAAYADVAEFDAERVDALDDAYHAWRTAEGIADAAAHGLTEDALTAAELRELADRRDDAGTLDESAFNALRAAAGQADTARAAAAAASYAAAVARADRSGTRSLTGMLLAAAFVAWLTDAGVAIAHVWVATAVASAIAVVVTSAAFARGRVRGSRLREAERKQRDADAALREEHVTAAAVARVLEPLRIATMAELVQRRARYVTLLARAAAANKAEARAQSARDAAAADAARFDALANDLVPASADNRSERRAAAHARAARRAERDGLDARLAMLELRRGDILHGDDDRALQAEYDALLAAGVEPAPEDDPQTLRAVERERAELDARARAAERAVANLDGELRAGEETIPDVAALDETLAATRAEIARLEAFERAIDLARATIETRKDEAHRAFARRLEEYSADVLATITAGRYGEIRLDPATLAIRVRIPETNGFEDVDTLSAGTRDQIALVVRFATARMFAEGLETPPLLLDDPFAFWDADRITRCLPILIHGALDTQCILFTASTEFADAATAEGATRIDLRAPVAV